MELDHLPLFVDTSFVYALINKDDQWHDAAVRWQDRIARAGWRLVTTEFVLVEIGNGLAGLRFRHRAIEVIDSLREDRLVETISAGRLFEGALTLYRTRHDKAWGLTDCTSFVAMHELGLSAALSSDRHFTQAGFRALLLDDANG